jgi:hypothetical protein
MNVISVAKSINIIVSATEAELIVNALRDKNTKHEHERTMTPQLKDQIITSIMLIEGVILTLKDTPELPQVAYDFQS